MQLTRAALEERLRNIGEKAILPVGIAAFVSYGFLNFILQEAKHGYYTARRIPHQKITNDPNSSFQYYLRS